MYTSQYTTEKNSTPHALSYAQNVLWRFLATTTFVMVLWVVSVGSASAATLTLSGTLYSDEGTTAITSGKTVAVAVGTSTPSLHSATSNGSGVWSIVIPDGHSIGAGTPINIWVDADAGTRAALLTKASSTADITGLNLYQNRVIVRNEATSGTTTRTTDMAFYDADNDADIQFTANSGALTTTDGQGLYIWANSIFEPSGTTTVGGNYTNNGKSIYSGGNWIKGPTTGDSSWRAITYNNNKFVAVANGGTNRVMTSADGITWATSSAAEANQWQSVTYGNGTFVAVAQTGTNRVMTSADGITWATSSAAEANQWQSVTYGNGTFVAVATDGTNRVMTSTNGINWTARSAAGNNLWQSVTYGNGLFVAVTASGTNQVMTSPDGINWTARTAAEASGWHTVTYGGGLFVAVAGTGTNRVMTSPDGINWTARSAAEANRWRSVIYGDGLYVATAMDGNNEIMTSPDGVNWTSFMSTEANSWYAVTYGNGTFVAVSTDGTNRIMTSTSTPFILSSVSAQTATGTMIGASAFGNVSFSGTGTKTFSANASTSNFTIASTSGLVTAPSLLSIRGNYTNNATTSFGSGTTTLNGDNLQTLSGNMTNNALGSSAFNNLVLSGEGNKQPLAPLQTTGNFIVMASTTFLASSTLALSGNFTQNGVYQSAATTTWKARGAAEANYWRSVTYGNGLFVAVAISGTNRVMTSADGITWATSSAAEANKWQSVTYGNGTFVAVSCGKGWCGDTTSINRVMTSTDGATWTARSTPEANQWRSVTYGNDLFVAVSSDGTNRVMTSVNGTAWTAHTAAEANAWQSVTYGNGLFVAVANSGTNRVMTSVNGTAWTAHTAAEANAWQSVTYGNGLFVAVAQSGTNRVMTSPDGITWTARSATENNLWTSVTYGKGLFVAVHCGVDSLGCFPAGNQVMTSLDGITWTARTAAEANAWQSVTYGNGLFVVVSAGGTNRVMTSTAIHPITLNGATAQTLSGTMIATSTLPSLIFSGAGAKTFSNNASTTDIIIATTSGAITAGTALTITGNLSNGSTFTAPTNLYLSGTNQAATGSWSGAPNLVLLGSGTKILYTNATTTDLFISASTTLSAPTLLSISGNYTNNGVFTTATTSTTTFNGSGAQIISGTTVGTSTFGNVVFSGAGQKTFSSSSASTTNFVVQSGSGEVVAPESLTVRGNYQNNSTATMAGAKWIKAQSVPIDLYSTSLTYGSSTYVAVGNDTSVARVMYSYNGTNWTNTTSDGGGWTWKSVTYGNGLFVAVGGYFDDFDTFENYGFVMTSPDGITWTAQTITGLDKDIWSSVTYGNGLFVAVAEGGTNRVMTSPNGINWTARSAAGDNDSWYSVTYGNGLFVAVGLSGDRVMTSPNGINWTARSAAGNNDWWSSVTYGNGLFVAVAANGTDRVMTSPDGINWTARSAAGDNDSWYSVTYGNGLFVAVGLSGDRVMTSSDGITWTARSALGDNDSWYSVTYGGGLFVVSGGGPDTVMTSTDTTLWLTGASDQILSGTLTGASALRDVRVNTIGTTTFASNASTTNLTIKASSTAILPSALSLAGNYTNNGTLNAGSGTVFLSGSNPQTLSGTMTATSSFNNLTILNNSRVATTTFDAAITANNLTAQGATYISLKSGATTTVATLTLNGSSTAPVHFDATATGTASNFVLTGSASVSYTTVYNNNACGSAGGVISIGGGNNIDGGNTTCWTFVSDDPVIDLAQNEQFYVGQATATLSTVTVTESSSSTITSVNDLRLTIATTTTNFRFDTNTTSLTFGGTASGKVAGTVTYSDGGATMVIDVTTNFAVDDTLTIADINVGSFVTASVGTSQLALHTDGNTTGDPAALTPQTIHIIGALAVANHDAGQVNNQFSSQNKTQVPFFNFKLTASGEVATVTDMVVTLSGVDGINTSKISNFKLYRDTDSDGALDGGDLLIDGSGILNINGQYGAITFSTDFIASTSANYFVVGDTTGIEKGDAVTFSLNSTSFTTLGATSNSTLYPLVTVSSKQHSRYLAAGGGSSQIGSTAPAGASTETGGGSGGGGQAGQGNDGANIVPNPDFAKPSGISTPSEWTNPTNAYTSDGVYATAATSNLRQTYINFGFNIPGGNSVQGLAVKLDASGTTASGTIDVSISWNNGESYTTAKATPTLTGADVVYTVGGNTDTWGRAWTPSEFNNGNFILRVTAQPGSNTIRLDALEVRIFHQAGGGGSGGGGGI